MGYDAVQFGIGLKVTTCKWDMPLSSAGWYKSYLEPVVNVKNLWSYTSNSP
jgi:hypothetical protein